MEKAESHTTFSDLSSHSDDSLSWVEGPWDKDIKRCVTCLLPSSSGQQGLGLPCAILTCHPLLSLHLPPNAPALPHTALDTSCRTQSPCSCIHKFTSHRAPKRATSQVSSKTRWGKGGQSKQADQPGRRQGGRNLLGPLREQHGMAQCNRV